MSRYVVQAGWDDVPHLSDQDKAELSKSLAPHQKDARMKGIPSLGSGAIYPIPEEEIVCDPFQIPKHFAKVFGLDVGWKKTAAIWGAWDRDADIVYLFSEHYRGYAEPRVHATAIKARGKWIPGNIDYAGTNQTDGTRVMQKYESEDLVLFPADKSVEAGLMEVLDRLSTGRLKIFSTLQNTLKEYRIYRRDEKGKIVKKNDHLMDALRYLIMGLHNAKTKPIERSYDGGYKVADRTVGY